MSNEFAGTLYPTRTAMLAGIAAEFMTAGGMNSVETVAEIIAKEKPADLARQAIDGWSLDRATIEDEPSHMDREGYTAEDLTEAFVEYIAEFKADAEDEDEDEIWTCHNCGNSDQDGSDKCPDCGHAM